MSHSAGASSLFSVRIPGALLFVTAFAFPAIIAIRTFLWTENDDRLLWGRLGCGLTGFYAYNFWTTRYTIHATSLSFWTLAGAIIGASRYQYVKQNVSSDTTAG